MAAKVLLVDDYADALDTWRVLVGLAGYDVVTAVDGLQAVRRAIAEHPDVIVMDLDLPVMSGLDALRALRRHRLTRDIPVIGCTGHSRGRLVHEAAEAGFRSVLLKPVDPDRMLDEIARAAAEDRIGDDLGGSRTV